MRCGLEDGFDFNEVAKLFMFSLQNYGRYK
jgi:hypothetical protein